MARERQAPKWNMAAASLEHRRSHRRSHRCSHRHSSWHDEVCTMVGSRCDGPLSRLTKTLLRRLLTTTSTKTLLLY
jgi:hypothetical protein